ncbi:adenylate/guanylate cyclase domain-containing protein [Mycobacterium sp. NPDC004974]
MVDLNALEAAGIADARQRAELIEYLSGLGFSVDDMVEAERRGRLFGLAGDAIRRPGPPTYSLRSAAAELGLPLDDVGQFWAALDLGVPDPDDVTLTEADFDALATCAAMRARLGDDGGLLRLIGSAMTRLAEAETTLLRTSRPDFWITRSHDELTTARAWREVAELIPRIGALLDTVHRHQTTRPRLFESVTLNPAGSVTCGVGFADLSGFTALTHVLSPAELSTLLNGFNAAVTDVMHAGDSRVVKFIGDAAMWVSSTPDRLVQTAADLVEDPRTQKAGLQVRAGLSYGEVLAIGGDYFGDTVNLAARLVAAASPGQILAAPEVRAALPDWPAVAQDPLTLKGFDEPVTTYDMSGCDRS